MAKQYLEITGTIGSFGQAKGRARIILEIGQGADFKDGEILVTRVTSPKFVPLIKKSSAVVVDEGGILCHAAIVAREFKKPCVVATKIATQLLKDGDLIEVDAEKSGIIRIVE